MRLSTQLHRSLFALPLLAVGLLATTAGDASPVSLPVPAALAEAALPGLDCSNPRPAGPRGLARVPGDIATLGRRLRCAS
ncbi:hypothetical protein [Arenimonas sp. MALMAid1274]|uniref:hypothetical protein n=1 Tax=Arenimonas sp. MALMAid1274 TaxID=3411630 RepID=UPI003BA2C784